MWNSDDYKWAIRPSRPDYPTERFQSLELITFRLSKPCSVPGCHGAGTVHHMVSGRTKISSDVLTVTLCLEHHLLLEEIGDIEFGERYSIDLLACSLSTLRMFLAQHGFQHKWNIVDGYVDDLFNYVSKVEAWLKDEGLATRYKVDHKTVSQGTAKSRGKSSGKNLVPLTKTCNVFP